MPEPGLVANVIPDAVAVIAETKGSDAPKDTKRPAAVQVAAIMGGHQDFLSKVRDEFAASKRGPAVQNTPPGMETPERGGGRYT